MEDSKDKLIKKEREREKFLVHTLILSSEFQSGTQPSIQFLFFLFSLTPMAFQIPSIAQRLIRQ